ncbi:MAG: sugar isomerase [Alphaproteobacteria bacterium]|nr:sugar isomerase [Alphaproteobacteria bacterium]MBO7551608.1 hypothetical protein [Fibrobacter sp.]
MILYSHKEFSKEKKLFLTNISALIYQLTAVICGFILPQLILKTFGSETNGLLQSITHFLAVISFMELGVGAVIQSALFKPLASKDFSQISLIVSSGDAFFKRIAIALAGYCIVLLVFFPYVAESSFSWSYSATLVLAISISSFAQYYFGLMDNIFLISNQQGYIVYSSQIISIVLNTIVCVVLIKMNFSIQVVKFVSSIIFVIRPLFVRVYINQNYQIDRNCKSSIGAIKQKWDGIVQHIAHVVLERTDIIVLTLLSTLSNVSIYSIYHLIIYGVKNFFTASSHGFLSVLGELWAKNDEHKLRDFFAFVEYYMHSLVVLLFGCTLVLILPFIKIYLNGVDDAEYIQPLFSVLIVLAHAVHCLRTPYHQIIKAAGDYKRTKSCFMVSALLNLFSSLLLVRYLGLVGIAIGTLLAVSLQTIWMVVYDSIYLIHWPIWKVVKAFIFDFISIALIVKFSSYIDLNMLSYIEFFVGALEVFFASFCVIVLMSVLFYKKELVYLFNHLRKKIPNHKR